jgi:hypothetical protein
MIRYVIAAVVGCLYVAGSVWVVRSEGQSYRDGLSKTKLVAGDLPKSRPSSPPVTDDAVPTVALAETTPVTKKKAASKKAGGSPSKPRTDHSPPPTEVAVAKPKNPPAPDRAAGHPAAPPAANGHPLAQNAFWNRPELTKNWDLSALKPQDENRLGADFHGLITQLDLIDDESPLLSRVEDAAEPFLGVLNRKEIKYKFFILKSDAVNAFSAPGGYIYVCRGLFDLISEEEDYALQFAVGHEIAHVDLQHAIKCLTDPDVKKLMPGTVRQLFCLIIPFGYLGEDEGNQEFEADQWVLNKMQRFGRSRREIVIFLQKLDGYAKKNGFENGRAKPKPGQGLSPLENHFRAKTAARKRLKHLKQLMEPAAKASS